jgi:hypothetical protein
MTANDAAAAWDFSQRFLGAAWETAEDFPRAARPGGVMGVAMGGLERVELHIQRVEEPWP